MSRRADRALSLLTLWLCWWSALLLTASHLHLQLQQQAYPSVRLQVPLVRVVKHMGSSEVVMQNAGSDSIRANCVLTRWSLSAKDIVRLSPSRSHPQMSLEYLTNWSFSETVSQQGEYRSLQMLGRYISASDIWDVILHPYIACWTSIILPVCALQKESMWFGMRSTSCHLSVFFRLHSQYDISSALQRTVGRVAVKACHLAHCKMLQ